MTETRAGDRRQQTTAAEISEREQCRLLADERRRTIVAALAEQSSPVTLGELATTLGARETSRGNRDSHRTLEVRLHHVHLPLMADVGVIDYDPGENRVEPRQSRLEQLLQ